MKITPPESWPEAHRDVPAYASGGKIYVRSDVPADVMAEVIPMK